MKKAFLPAVMAACLMLSGCAVHQEAAFNMNQQQTSVVLNQKNFEVVRQVRGSVTNTYALGFIGGISKKTLHASAMSELNKNADLKGAEALINTNVQYKYKHYVLWTEVTVIATGTVVRFTD